MSRLSPGTLLVAVVAVLLALTGAFAVRQFLADREPIVAEEQAEPVLVTIPVAVTELESGRELRESDFTTLKMTPEKFAASKYASQTFIGTVDQIKGRVIHHALKMGDTVGPEVLYAEGTGPNVAERLPRGMRAVTVKVEGSGFVDGFAAPGTIVDVLFRSEAEKHDDELPETTITALHGVQVLAVDASPYPLTVPDRDNNQPLDAVKVTLAVLPAQATMLKALEDRGSISLALLSNEEASDSGATVSGVDNTTENRHAQTLTEILEGAKPPLFAVAITELPQGRVVRAGDVRLIEVSAELVKATDKDSTYSDVEALVGRVLRSDVTPGQILTADLLYPEGVGPGVADRLPSGFRAVTVKMNQAGLVDGFVSPGTEVDVFFRAEALEGYPETTLRVLDGLEVLAIENRVSPGSDPQQADQVSQDVRVTLAVPLGEVGRLQALNGHGTMTLAVRASQERAIGEIARELENTRQELDRTQQQIAALDQIGKLDESIGLSKEQSERLASLLAELPQLERKLQLLADEKEAATTGNSQTTLAEVLNLPEPPRPVKLEIYSGGNRETLVFNSRRVPTPSSTTASRATPDSTPVKDTSVITTPKPVATDVSEAQDVKVEKVSSVTPDRKVSAIQQAPLTDKTDKTSVRKPVGDRRGDAFFKSVADFGRELVAGLSKATQPASRVEIVRGGVKDELTK